MIEPIDGGVTAAAGFRAAAAGFRAAGTACGIKSEGLDVALIVCDAPASAAGLFTTNLTRAAPVTLSVDHLTRTHGVATAVVVMRLPEIDRSAARGNRSKPRVSTNETRRTPRSSTAWAPSAPFVRRLCAVCAPFSARALRGDGKVAG